MNVPEREHLRLRNGARYGMIPLGIKKEVSVKDMKEVGAFVARVRKSQGISQLELALAADVGRRFVVELEAGKATLQSGKLLKVLSVLGIGLRLVEPKGV